MTELYLIDERAPMGDAMQRFIPRSDATLLILPDDDMATVAQGALTRLAEPQFAHAQIRGLTIMAHGNAGYMQLGTGLTLETADALAPLAGRMQRHARHRIRLFGCYVASGSSIRTHPGRGDFESGWGVPGSARDYFGGAGYQFMRRLAQIFQASVIAACDEQFATGTRDTTLVRGVVYEGQVMQVDPYGAFTISEDGRVCVDSRSDLF